MMSQFGDHLVCKPCASSQRQTTLWPYCKAVREVCLWRAADGTKDYVDMMAYDLSRLAVTGLINKTAISPSEIDYLLWGTVSQEIRTSNIARDVALGSGLPKSVTGHTVTQACISANQAICNGVQQIQTAGLTS